ncbi:MAG: tandem-95 repeat protein, partial [Pirellula sp.]
DTFNFNEDSSNNALAVLNNDTITPGSNAVLTLQSLGTPSRGGTVAISSDSKQVTYTPAANINGQETFTYTVRDQNGATATATVTVQLTAVNDNPVAVNDTLDTVRTTDRDVFINVLTNDTMGPDTGETLTVTQVGTPSQGGTVRVGTGGNGAIYTPRSGFTGTETFTYTLSDGNGGTATGTVTVTVSPAVPPPTVVGESFSINEDAVAADFNVLSNDTPAQTGDTLTITDVKAPNGTATITNNGSRISFAPKANFSGQELVIYTVRSSNGGTATGTATFTIAGVNDAPDATNDTLRVLSTPDQSVSVLQNDPLVDVGDTYSITAVTQPETGKGTVRIATDNKSILYSAPNTNFTGTVTFTYTISDGTGTDTATVTLTVDNFAPRDVGIVYDNFDFLPVTVEYVLPSDGANYNTAALTLLPTSAGVKVANVGPGDYRFAIPDLPFVSGGPQSVVISSTFNDRSSLNTAINPGTRDARFIDIRDFMGQSLRRGITSAVAANRESAWTTGQGDWKNFKDIKVSLNTAGDQLTVRAMNPTNQAVQATLPVSDPKVVLRGKEGDASLYRIQATPAELTFTPVTATTSTTTNNSGSGSNAPSGEGEGGSAVPLPAIEKRDAVLNPTMVDQAMLQVKLPQRQLSSNNSSTANSSKPNDLPIDAAKTTNSTANSNPVSNGFRRGFRTR